LRGKPLERRIECDPFLKELRKKIRPGESLVNLLVAPVARGDNNAGVVVLANKLGGEFTNEDELVVLKFAERIFQDALSLTANRAKVSGGFEELERLLGPSIRLKDLALRRKVREVREARDKSQGEITGEDCAKFLQISRPYFLRLAKEPPRVDTASH
jgi:GAF domain-containing protein